MAQIASNKLSMEEEKAWANLTLILKSVASLDYYLRLTWHKLKAIVEVSKYRHL